MDASALLLTGAAAAASLAVGASAWAMMASRSAAGGRAAAPDQALRAAEAAAEAFDTALVLLGDGPARVVAGAEAFALCATRLGVAGDADAVIARLEGEDATHAAHLKALVDRGAACAFQAQGPGGPVAVEGRAAGALAYLRLSPITSEAGLPTAERLAAFIDGRGAPVWIVGPDGQVSFANQAWLDAVGAASVIAARVKGASFDSAADELAREAAKAGERREVVRWAAAGGQRRAFRFTAEPLEGGGVGVWSEDVTEAEEAAESLRSHAQAQDETLNQIREAVAIFGRDRRLTFHNAAFAELWGLEPAWLVERPAHAELLDRLRQRRRLPESADYNKWKAAELAAYEALAPSEDLWRLPDSRTLRVVRQPHPWGGLLLLFSDLTDELNLKSQFAAQIQVQQATLDKLTDAVAVFSADGRLKLHNEAFERFWGVSAAELAAAADFDGVEDIGISRLSDRQFWRDLKGRVTDPEPQARAPHSAELSTTEGRIVGFQSRPLPDGATLVGFADITDTRRLEGALRDARAALDEAERLKREFVGNVSYEFRTPLTTIIGYSELLEGDPNAVSERGRGHLAAVRAAAIQLGRSVDDVLDIAQIDAGEMGLDMEDVNVGRLLEAAIVRWAGGAASGQVALTLSDSADVGLIRGDSRRLGQMLDHLIENALRQTPQGGSITLAAERGGGEVRLVVADTGRGIPFHVQAHAFDRFVGRDQGGPGLGLALVKALVELHGGWVALESEPGAGSTFTCHLPEAAQIAAAPPELF